MRERNGWLHTAADCAMVACMLVIVVSVCLPNTALAWMRDHIAVFNQPMLWIENANSPINLVHLILFVILGACVGVARPRWHPAWVLMVIAVFGIVTELLQMEIPGRHPRIADVVVDVLGAALGLLVIKSLHMLHPRMAPSVRVVTKTDPARRACIALLRGEVIDVSHLSGLAPLDLLAAARREGVVSLLAERLYAIAGLSPALENLHRAFVEAARREAARNLLCHAQCRAISAALNDAGIDAIWMKGAALSHWLYASRHLRDLADVDLLLPDHATTLRAADLLAPLGYVLPNRHIAGDLVVHELLAWSDRAQLELDLHWRLSNDALFANRLQWQALREQAIELPALGAGAFGLAPEHAFLHACLHRAINTLTGREDRLRWLYDIHLLALRFDATQWQHVVRDATSAELADACVSALGACQHVFATQIPAGVLQSLDEAAKNESVRTARLGNWTYLQKSTWQHLPDLRTRLRWLRQLLFPDMAHLRVRYGADGAGALKLSARRLLDGWRRWRGYHRVNQ